MASLKAKIPAILKAISEESTSWKDPSTKETLKSITGYPAMTAPASSIPSKVGLMNSLGMAPPTILFSNSIPFPFSRAQSE